MSLFPKAPFAATTWRFASDTPGFQIASDFEEVVLAKSASIE
jgi:hypothetical protein